MARKSNTDKLYAKLLIFAEELHMGNKRRIRNGFISLAVLPVLLIIIRLLTDSSRVVFLLIWILTMFVAAAFLIFVAYVDRQLQDTLNELAESEKKEFDSLLEIRGRSVAKPRRKPAEKAVEKPVASAVEKAVEQVVEKAVAQAVEKAVAQVTGQAQQATEKTEENAPEQADGKADEK